MLHISEEDFLCLLAWSFFKRKLGIAILQSFCLPQVSESILSLFSDLFYSSHEYYLCLIWLWGFGSSIQY